MRKTCMNRLVAAAIAFACCLAAWAMPTKEELVQAQELVKDLTADDVRALKSGAKKPGEVAAAQMALADEAETEAGKYLLLGNAAWGASFPSERALPAGGFGSVHTPSP